MLTEKTFDTGTVAVHYVEGPPGRLPLIMLHGITTRWQTFIPVLPLFTSRYHTFALDLRGHGASGRVSNAYRIADYADDVIRLLREHVKEPALLLGWSLGAHVTIQVAATVPELVQAVVLEEPPLLCTSKARFESNPVFQWFQTVHDLLKTQPSRAEIQAFVAKALVDDDAVSVQANAKAWSQTDPIAFAQLLNHQTHAHFDPEELLPKITCPVLLLQGNGELGALLEDQDVQQIRSLLRNCTHIHWQDVAHNFHHMQPVRYHQLVSHFFESL